MNKETKMEFLMSILSHIRQLEPKHINEIKTLEIEKVAWTESDERRCVSFTTSSGYEFSVRMLVPAEPKKEKV